MLQKNNGLRCHVQGLLDYFVLVTELYSDSIRINVDGRQYRLRQQKLHIRRVAVCSLAQFETPFYPSLFHILSARGLGAYTVTPAPWQRAVAEAALGTAGPCSIDDAVCWSSSSTSSSSRSLITAKPLTQVCSTGSLRCNRRRWRGRNSHSAVELKQEGPPNKWLTSFLSKGYN